MNLTELQQQIETAIEQGITTVEEFHKQYSGLALEQLQQIEQIASPVANLKELHDNTLSNVYSFIKGVNTKGGETVRNLLSSLNIQ